ncbi:MAG: prepilin-type N-terminal cleavage/methylation domain-containing protein, partial [Patescibacteria group bacterium]|nr:prepilin-type N-terminal cleavage/methylation domain-containing protein [Patescibacteria group bacterium]
MKKGFTLIETVVAVGVFATFFTAIFLIVNQILTNLGTSQVRAVALSIAQTKIELIRNLPYQNVGTIGGIPSGPIQQNETIQQNNQTFTVKTDIVYIDDPFDRTVPNDPIPADYKRVRIQVTWGGIYP